MLPLPVDGEAVGEHGEVEVRRCYSLINIELSDFVS